MLDLNRQPQLPVRAPLEDAADTPIIDFRYLLGVLRRRLWLIVSITALALACGWAYLVTTPPTYLASARLILEERQQQDPLRQQGRFNGGPADTAIIESQVQLLTSEGLLQKVVLDLGLVEDGELAANKGGFLRSAISWALGRGTQSGAERDPVAATIISLRRQLDVHRIGLSYVIEVSFWSTAPKKAARVANAIVDAYLADQVQTRLMAAQRSSEWLSARMEELGQQASAAERAMAEFKANSGVVDAGRNGPISEQQLSELSSQLIPAKSQTAQAKARLDRIAAINQSATPETAIADSLGDPSLNELREQYMRLARQEADWASRYSGNHFGTINLRNQMNEVRRTMRAELQRLEASTRSDYEIALAREQQLQADVDAMVAKVGTAQQAQVELRGLESNATSYRTLYETFLQRYLQTAQQQYFPNAEARVIAEATPPTEKDSPSGKLTLAIALTAGLGLGGSAAFLRELLNRTIVTNAQLEAATGAESLGFLPVIRNNRDAVGSRAPKVAEPPPEPGPVEIDGQPQRQMRFLEPRLRVAVDAPFSRFSETIRRVKVAADLNGLVTRMKVIGIVSSVQGEGKSTMACNLARLIARGGKEVLLIDADLRKSSLTRVLTRSPQVGLVDVVMGRAPFEQAVWTDQRSGLNFLPGTVDTTPSGSSDILASEAMKHFVDAVASVYDYVIVDLPPLSGVVDVRAGAHLIDGFVVVAEWQATTTDVLKTALATSGIPQEKILGGVLNKVDLRMLKKYEGLSENYYSDSYFHEYSAHPERTGQAPWKRVAERVSKS